MFLAAAEPNELLDLFTRYNRDLWPIHIVVYAAGFAATFEALVVTFLNDGLLRVPGDKR